MDSQGKNAVAYCSTQLIDGDGTLNAAGLESLTKKVKLAEFGISYTVVAVMGPQSSGKSTLLNRLFKTKFAEMDSRQKKSQTTKGIWMANCVGIEPCTLVMDIEGTDGSERGEDDTVFERQSALFALAVSDILLINMWWSDVNRENAGNKPLLRTVFQVMLQLFPPRKTTLLFVIRDTTIRTPLDIIVSQVKDSIQKIWESVPKPEAREGTSLSEVFRVEVVTLSNFELEEEKFTEEVANLRQRFFQTTPGWLAPGDTRGVVPGSGFSLSAKQIWKDIKANRDLDLPSHKVMLATVRCEEIAKQTCSFFDDNTEWCKLKVDVQSHPVTDFGTKLTSILNICLSRYDAEAEFYEDSVRSKKRKQLEETLLQLAQPTYHSMLEHFRAESLAMFIEALSSALDGKQEFMEAVRDCTTTCIEHFEERCADVKIKQANWENASVRIRLDREIELVIQEVENVQKKQKEQLGVCGLAADIVVSPVRAAGKLGDHIAGLIMGSGNSALRLSLSPLLKMALRVGSPMLGVSPHLVQVGEAVLDSIVDEGASKAKKAEL